MSPSNRYNNAYNYSITDEENYSYYQESEDNDE